MRLSGQQTEKLLLAERKPPSRRSKLTRPVVWINNALRESFSFHAILAAAMTRVLDEADEANEFVFGSSPTDGPSVDAYEARTHLTKRAFTELRAACVRYGGRLTLLRRLQLSPRRVLRRELEAGRLLRVEAADGHRSKVPRKRGHAEA